MRLTLGKDQKAFELVVKRLDPATRAFVRKSYTVQADRFTSVLDLLVSVGLAERVPYRGVRVPASVCAASGIVQIDAVGGLAVAQQIGDAARDRAAPRQRRAAIHRGVERQTVRFFICHFSSVIGVRLFCLEKWEMKNEK